jgi:peptidoglycan/xylan/chitin deacetylase (PgdA/CDA1 family)
MPTLEQGHIYQADTSIWGKLRRRASRLILNRPAHLETQTRPMLTFSFDDVPASAALTGAQCLEARGVRGTYFLATAMMESHSHLGRFASADEIRALNASGHEIAAHTHDHIDCGTSAYPDICANVAANINAFADMGLSRPETFAYPYGDVSPQAKLCTLNRFKAARGLAHGIVRTGVDLNQAPAIGLEGPNALSLGRRWLKRASLRPDNWLIFYSHDVRESPSNWGCVPETLARLIDEGLDLGFDVVTFAEGAKRATKA